VTFWDLTLTYQILIVVGIFSYLLMVAFNCGLWWKRWGCTGGTEGEEAVGVFVFSVLWIVTVPVYLMWQLGGYLIKRFG